MPSANGMKYSDDTSSISIRYRSQDKGFALVATIAVMVLLVMIALAMLSLSTIELRSSQQGQAMQDARANARMALMLAIGELQKNAGSDRRVTARASLLDESIQHPHTLGVWDSWGEGLEDGSQLTESNVAVTYTKGREARFRSWLVPGDDADDFEFPQHSLGSDHVALVGEGSLGSGADPKSYVSMPRIPVKVSGQRTGSYSWWVTGENSKARVNLYKEQDQTLAGQALESVAAPTVAVREIKEMETLAQDETVLRGVTRGSLDFLAQGGGELPDSAKYRFHDVSVDSMGLLTNTKSGGVRKDLNLMLEQGGLPSEFSKTEIYSGGPVWDNLRTYYRSYKPLAEGGFVKWVSGVPHYSGGETWKDYVGDTNWRRHLPIPVKWQWLISHYSVPADPEEHGPGKFQVRMVFDNVMEMWNPYTIPMRLPSDSHVDFKLWNIPYGITYYLNGERWSRTQTKKALYWMISDMPNHRNWQMHNALIRSDQALMPGEVKVYSDHSEAPQEMRWVFDLKPGWEMSGGLFSWSLGHGGHQLVVPGGTEIEAVMEADGSAGVWDNLDHFTDIYFVGPNGYPNEFGYFKGIISKDSLDLVAPSLARTSDASFTASGIAGVGNKKPLAIMGMRMRTERRIEPSSESPISKSEQAKVKHYLYNDPWQQNSDVRNNNQTTMRHGGYEYFIQRVNSLNDYPFVEVTADDKGYLGTSRGAREPYNGQNHVSLQEVPYQPLISMAQLQHAGLGHPWPDPDHSHNPSDPDGGVPYVSYPYVANALGNAWALPFIGAQSIEQTSMAPHNGASRLLHDKCWKANEALWDDWCFSSISPQDQELIPNSKRRSMMQVLSEAVEGALPLPNSRYRFINKKQGEEAQEVVDALWEEDGYKKVAAMLACDGAFNVNSTSVEAWKAFLASLDGRSLAWLSAETGQFKQKETERYPVSRFTIPNADGAETDEFAGSQRDFLRKRWEGVRSLTNYEIEELAEAMVEQVRERGPFLSLAEFVNRRLDTGESGLRGALQAAIDQTSINESFDKTSDQISQNEVADAAYKNPQAAIGTVGEGAPGYVTQADILMPLAPLVRVRSDTFKIRAYGESLDSQGRVQARAYCEAVVQRYPEYVDQTDAADKEVWSSAGDNQLTAVNQSFGRRFKVKSFRWLSSDEV